MSLVYITHHDENIFDVEHDSSKGHSGKPSSKFKAQANVSASLCALRQQLDEELKKQELIIQGDGLRLLTGAKKAGHRTMGCAKVQLQPPCAYLRKNEGIKWRRENLHVCPKGIREMPPLPGRAPPKRKPTLYPNFVQRNKKCARNTISCAPPPRYVDTPFGTRHPVLNSGMVPQFICRKDFGKVPIYLKKTKQMLSETREAYLKEEARMQELCRGMKTRGGPPFEMAGMRIMEREERNHILEGLKQHLEETTKQYQSMSLLIDTVAKRQRKGKLEKDLRQAEQDILLIETSPLIYVSQY